VQILVPAGGFTALTFAVLTLACAATRPLADGCESAASTDSAIPARRHMKARIIAQGSEAGKAQAL
jgi:hypothetical protein